MEGKKQGSSTSSSSFTADLFGVKEHSPPQHSTGIFASIFPPPSKVEVLLLFIRFLNSWVDKSSWSDMGFQVNYDSLS